MISADRVLTCRECNRQFTFTASEQDFYAQKGFTQDPGRCPDCRAARKAQRGLNSTYGSDSRPPRQMYKTTCSSCGGVAEVPFTPSGNRPVYCRDCFSQNRG